MKNKTELARLDAIVVARGFADSLHKAQAMILAGEIFVAGIRVNQAGMKFPKNVRLEVDSREQKYASRGGFKLEGALRHFKINPKGWNCLDVGSSTGGFTDCLLQHGAARVYAVDVNVNQIAWKLRQDARVVLIKRNGRELKAGDLADSVELATLDVSFISVGKVLAPAVAAARSGAEFLVLVKPQFELGREEIGAGGIVAEPVLHEKAIAIVREEAESAGLIFQGVQPSELMGAEGNQEYFLHARKKSVE